MKEMTFVAATNNPGKLEEIRAGLRSVGCRCISLVEAGLVCDPEETGSTFRQNAFLKARSVYDLCRRPVIADDSGLQVDALDGAPGVITARYAGRDATDDENIDKLLEELNGVEYDRRNARFVSVICVILDDDTTLYARGICEGVIGGQRRGQGGFGYDPVFLLPGNWTVAELDAERKLQISHRGRAIRKMAFRLRGIHRIRLK